MKRFFLTIFLFYLVMNEDNSILAKPPKDVVFRPDSKQFKNALEKVLKVGVKQLNVSIPNGSIYQTEKKELLFVKKKSEPGYDKKYLGEYESLKAILNTKTVLVPRPIAIGHTDDNVENFIVLEYMNMTRTFDAVTKKLGSQLADMHLYNLQPNNFKKQPAVKKFGFHVETSIGHIPQNNTWTNDWITFFIDNRMGYQVELMKSVSTTDVKIKKIYENLWPKLKPIIPRFFKGIDVKPSLLHGDIWAGNVIQYGSDAVIVDPSSFYGHHEYDIASASIFGGYPDEFFEEYHKKIPKAKGHLIRIDLYHLYNYLTYWNHVRTGCETLMVELFEKLIELDFERLNI